MKILVTGATGFLGTHLTRKLNELHHEVTALGSKDADLTVDGSLNKFNDQQFDHIYHLAAWTQAGDFCLHHPGEQWVINQKMNTNVVSWWHEHQPQAKLVVMGSSCCYPTDQPLVEENFLEGHPIESLFSYGMTKRMMYIGLTMLHRQFGHEYLCLVPSTLYGPDYHTDDRQLHFIFDLTRKIVNAKYKGDKVTLWGDGHQARELFHVKDYVNAMVYLAENVSNDIVNVASGEEHPIRWFAQQICDIVGYDHNLIEYDTSKYTGAKSKVLGVEKLNKLMPHFESTPFEDGLKETVEWFIRAHGFEK